MRILLATDGSEQSKAAVNEIAARPFPTDTSIRIVSAYERTSLLTRVEPMGVSEEFYARADHDALKAAEDATENAATAAKRVFICNPRASTPYLRRQGGQGGGVGS